MKSDDDTLETATNGFHPILLIEDHEELADNMKELFLDSGWDEVEIALNGRIALERLHAGLRPCVIILDLFMPEMDGYQFLAELSKDEELYAIPLLILTAAYAVKNLGFDNVHGVMRKPPDVEAILRFLRDHC